VPEAGDPRRAGVGVGDRPADVVVTAYVGHPRRGRGDLRHAAQRLRGEPGVLRGQAAPQHDHQLVLVGQLALRAVPVVAPEVGHEVLRGDDGLGLEEDPGRRQPGQRVQHLQEGVALRLVLAAGSLALPHEGHGVHPEDIHAAVGQPGDLAEHRQGDGRVRVVEVPLVGPERGPHPAACTVAGLRHPAEGARRPVGEHLRDRRVVGVGQLPVGERGVEVGVRRVAGQPGLRPGVLAGRVVEHQVDAQAHVPLVQLQRHLLQVGHRAQPRVHRAVVHDRVAAVVLAGPGPEQRHQVQIGDAELTQVVQPSGQLGEGAAEAVDVADVALHPGVLEPGRVDLAPTVETPQVIGTLGRCGQRRPQCPLEERVDVRSFSVQQGQRLVDVQESDPDAGEESVGLVRSEGGDGVVGQPGTQHLPRLLGGCSPVRARCGHFWPRDVIGSVFRPCSPTA
jgi:hypothetical protein